MTLNSYLQRTYEISQDEYETLLMFQGGVCAICKQTNPAKGDQEPERLSVDHNHLSGTNRALLCRRCNWVLGQIKDSQELLLRMLFYLREHDGVPVVSNDFGSHSEQMSEDVIPRN